MTPIISQFDLITGYGRGLDALWGGLMEGRTAIAPTDRFKDRDFVSNQAALVPDLHVEPGESRVMAMLRPLLSSLVGKLDRETPLILATTVGEIEHLEYTVLGTSTGQHSFLLPHLLGRIKEFLGLTGRAEVVSSACASSTAAVARAASTVRRGEACAVLVVACDSVSEFVYSGFSTLQSLSESPAKPFDISRCGLSLGEAAAWALVTTSESPGNNPDAVSILGWSSTSDAVHMTAPDREARGLSRAIQKACKMSGRKVEELAFVAAHGTATVYSDAMELLAIGRAKTAPVPVFSVKGGTGHTLGAAGLVQILVSARALNRGMVPPTVGLSEPDAAAKGWVHSSPAALDNPAIALSTNSGFGGVNTSIVLGRPDEEFRTTTPRRKGSQVVRALTWSHGESSERLTEMVGRPIKYLGRMTSETRSSLAAACKALRSFDLDPDVEIGILAGGPGFHFANLEYFKDYVNSGRSMGRGNLFIYTLPTSAASEVAIALGLKGPTLYAYSPEDTVESMIATAGQILSDGEAQIMLVLWNALQSSVCFAVTLGFDWNYDPSTMSNELAKAERPQ